MFNDSDDAWWNDFVKCCTWVLSAIGFVTVILTLIGVMVYLDDKDDLQKSVANAQCGSCRLGNNK